MPLTVNVGMRATTFAELSAGDLFVYDYSELPVLCVKGSDVRDFAIMIAVIDKETPTWLPSVDEPADHAAVLKFDDNIELEPMPAEGKTVVLPNKNTGIYGAPPNGALVVDGNGEPWIALSFRGTTFHSLRDGKEGAPPPGRMSFHRWRIVRRGSTPDRDLVFAEINAARTPPKG